MSLLMCCWPAGLAEMTAGQRKEALAKWKCKHQLVEIDEHFRQPPITDFYSLASLLVSAQTNVQRPRTNEENYADFPAVNKALNDAEDSPYYIPHGEEYKYHMQQMVIAKDPIKYLGEHI